jgi:hypothetical protein
MIKIIDDFFDKEMLEQIQYHISNIPNLKRYTATLFIEDYEDV